MRLRYNGIDFGGEDASVPYGMFAHTNNVADGAYVLTAIARNLLGEQTTSAPVTVTVDNCLALNSVVSPYPAVPVSYPDEAAWAQAMNDFASGIALGLHAYGQLLHRV